MKHFSNEHVRTLVLSVVGAGLLIGAAVFISDQSQGGKFLSQALQESQSAAVYWSNFYTSYNGYPNPLGVTAWAQGQAKYGCNSGPCNSGYPNCSNPGIAVMSISGGYAAGASFKRLSTAPTASGNARVTGNEPVTLDWACQPSVSRSYIEVVNSDYKCNPYPTQKTTYATNAVVTGPTGDVISTGPLTGSVGVTPGGVPGTVKTYTLTCTGAGTNVWAVTVPVRILADRPAVGISGNNTNPTNVTVGTPVTIRGTFVAKPGDALTHTALNDYKNDSLPGVTWTPPTDKTYVFTPAAPGTYTFYPSAKTLSYSDYWDNYGASLTVNVSCPERSTKQGNTCVCDQYYSLQGGSCVLSCPANATASNGTCLCPANANMINGSCVCSQFYSLEGGSCVLHCPLNAGPSGSSCACEPGYTMAAGNCLLVDACLNIPGTQNTPIPHSGRDNQGNCNCDTGYTLKNNQCVIAAVLSLQANGSQTALVRAGGVATLTWSTSNVTANSCRVTDSSGVVIASGSDNTPSPAPQATITRKTIFTLTCRDQQGDPHSVSATVNLVPTVQEL